MTLPDQSERGRYEAHRYYPEGTRCLSAVDDLRTAFGDAGVGGDVYDTLTCRWVSPDALDERGRVCQGCRAEFGTRHRSGCPYEHPWPNDKVDHVQTRIPPVGQDAFPRTHPKEDR